MHMIHCSIINRIIEVVVILKKIGKFYSMCFFFVGYIKLEIHIQSFH